MRRPPRPQGEGVITPKMWFGIVFVGAIMAAGTLLVEAERPAAVERLVALAAVYRVQAVEGAESPSVAQAPVLLSRTTVAVVLAWAKSDWCERAPAAFLVNTGSMGVAGNGGGCFSR